MDQDQSNAPQGNTGEGIGMDTQVSKNMIIVSVLAVIVVVLALMYLWGSNIETPRQNENDVSTSALPPLSPNDAQIQALGDVSTSDELEAIEQDLVATDLETLDTEINQVEAELVR